MDIILQIIDALPLDPAVAQTILTLLGAFGVHRGSRKVKAKREATKVAKAQLFTPDQETWIRTYFQACDAHTDERCDSIEHRIEANAEELHEALAHARESIAAMQQAQEQFARSGSAPTSFIPLAQADLQAAHDLADDWQHAADDSTWGKPPMPVGVKTIAGQLVPRNVRNNNPGNIVDFGKDDWRGLADPRNDGVFYRFTTPVLGARALCRASRNGVKHDSPSFYQFFAKYAPAGNTALTKGNDPKRYAEVVAKALGVSPTSIPQLQSDEDCARFARAVADHEGDNSWSLEMFAEGARLARK